MPDIDDVTRETVIEKATSDKALRLYFLAGGALALAAAALLGYFVVTLKPGETASVAGVEIMEKAPSRPGSLSGEGPSVQVYCEKVNGLDTMELCYGGVTERVRLVGVRPPACSGGGGLPEECYYYTKWMAEERDLLAEFIEGQFDEDGRALAYVFLDNGVMLNEEIIRQGYGSVSDRYGFAHLEEFRLLEEDARTHQRGIWKSKDHNDLR
ncbi:MAG: thermonuclease family protein [Nitrospirae bacterium]|nr:thermonuclease family protein [Nitrospirota bacterium]